MHITSMRRAMALAMGVVLLSIGALAQPAARKGVVRIKLQSEVARKIGHRTMKKAPGKQLATGVTSLDKAAASTRAYSIRPMLPPNDKFADRRAKYGLDRWYVVEFDETVTPQEAKRIFGSAAGVEISENVVPMSLKEGNGGFREVSGLPQYAAASSAYPFNDPQLPGQWHYKNFGTLPNAVAGADINLFDAWNVTTGNPEVVVAIIDGGVDYSHEDLARNMFVNQAELNGIDGVDDDGNGYVDDIYGFNFCTNTGAVYPHSHGTHVAGTVAAVNNNGIGVAGVAGGDGSANSGVRMISCQAFDSRNGVPDGDFAAAIVYACEMGATIAQCSWGWGADGYYEQAVLDAIDYFTAEAQSDYMTGGLCIFAAGNSGLEGQFYPSCYDKVVSVTAMADNLHPASYSNYGDWADLIAPGGLLDYGEAEGVLSTLPNNKYGFNEGTSMATPHVSGIAALFVSKYGKTTNITTDILRMQLLNSVNDFYGVEGNEQYRGKYGVGYIDALKAVTMGDGEAPSAVSDLSLAAAQDYVLASWTIPASSDNMVASHIIYYSTQPFTADNLAGVTTRTADTRFLSSGDRFEYEISNLSPLTDYYVAVQALNRYGQSSALSAVQHVRTNAGPDMTLSAGNVSMTSTKAQPVAEAEIEVGNEAEGLLKWSTTTANKNASAMPFSATRPASPGQSGAYKGTMNGRKVKRYARVSGDYEASDYPKTITYAGDLYAYIGDSDRSLPNSMAQWLRVDPETYPDGFNLTDVVIDGNYGQNPVIEIYRGETAISQATLLERVTYQLFTYGSPVALQKQIKLAPGQSVWIVVHFDGNQDGYPLGLCFSDTQGCGAYSYMSNDKGKTWTQLPAALAGSPYEAAAENLTWGIRARSSNPDWSEVLELTPDNGTVKQGETQKVQLRADGSKIVNGNYKFDVTFETNESEDPEHSVEVAYAVESNSPDVRMPKVVDFGSLLVGQSKTLTVEAFNQGYGPFRGGQWNAGIYSDNISCSSEHFKGPDYVQSGFPARTRTTFDVTYTPKSAGSHTGTVTFTDNEGNKATVVLQGAATEPAKVQVEPKIIDAGTLTVGEEPVTKTFTLSNNGKYPLEYVFPKFSDEQIEGATAKNHKHGYSVFANVSGYEDFQYDGNPQLANATNIASEFTDYKLISDAVPLGFSFPFYGKTYNRVYITSFGTLLFNLPETALRTPLSETSSCLRGTGAISVFGQELRTNPDTRISYAKSDGKFVVKYENVLAVVYGDEYTPVSFHVVLSSNGDVEMFYDDIDPTILFNQGAGIYCGMADPDMQDALTVTSIDVADYMGLEEPTVQNQLFREFGSGKAVYFQAPKASFIRALDKPAGIITPGETVELTATLGADASMDAGETFNVLPFVSNDPNPESTSVRFNAVIAGADLHPVAEIEKDLYDAGDVFRTSEVKIPVTVTNAGHDAMQITSVSMRDGKMTVTPSEPFELKPGLAKDLIVTVPTAAEGAVEDVINVATSAGNLSATVRANVIGCPQIGLGFESVEETVASGTPLVKNLTVTNNGNETLRYAVVPDPMVSLSLPENAGAVTSYSYRASIDDSSVPSQWVDIENDERTEHHTMSYYNLHDYVAVDLPFEFSFYGKKYTKMYVYNRGFISFTERHDDKLWPEPPGDFPAGSLYTNIIAPYWGLHTMDQTKTAGTYHLVSDDRVVVSFKEYGNTMNMGVDFQCVINKDGTFQFSYKGDNAYAIIFDTYGLAGIANEGGSQYIQLPSRLITFGNTVRFNPIVESPLAPGKSETVKMDFDTRKMAGDYSTVINVTTNQPGREKIEIPVNLTLTGEADIVWPQDVTVEHTIGYANTDYSDPMVQTGALYAAYFDVKNDGTANSYASNITVGGPTIYDEWFDMETPVFMLMYYAPEIDWITGEPTGKYQWQPYQEGMPVTFGETPVRFAVPMVNPEFAGTVGTTDVPVTFYNMEGEADHTVNVKFIVTPAPAMTLDRQEIYVKADDENRMLQETLKIGNEGEYKLTYDLRLDPSGIGEVVEDWGGGGIDPMLKPRKAPLSDEAKQRLRAPIVPAEKSDNSLDCPQQFEYNDALFYPVIPDTRSIYNYGTNNVFDEFKTSTSFVAPEGGFNLSHFYAPLFNNNMPGGVDLKIQVVQGSDPAGDVVLGSGTFHSDHYDATQTQLNVMELERPVYLNAGEEFCVVVTYPKELTLPTLLIAKEEGVVDGRYMAWTEEAGWYDVASVFEDQYGSLGYIGTCLETREGHPWIALTADTPATGEVAVGGEAQIRFDITPAAARMEKANKAVLVIKSNDPNQPVVNYPIVLDLNGKPVIDAPANKVFAAEGEETLVNVQVSDPDLDDYTFFFSGINDYCTVRSVEKDETDAAATITEQEDGYHVSGATMPVRITVAITPDYGSASDNHSFSLTALDSKGKHAEATVAYAIEHKNRAPEPTGINSISLTAGATSDVITYASLFNDPDGDEMTFEFSMPDQSYAEAYLAPNGVIFYGKTQGTVEATVTAKDSSGASAVKKLTVNVGASGIDGITADSSDRLLTVSPNPVEGDINAACYFDARGAKFSVFTTNGQLMRTVKADVTSGTVVVIPAEQMAPGIYLLTVETPQRNYTARIIKK